MAGGGGAEWRGGGVWEGPARGQQQTVAKCRLQLKVMLLYAEHVAIFQDSRRPGIPAVFLQRNHMSAPYRTVMNFLSFDNHCFDSLQ